MYFLVLYSSLQLACVGFSCLPNAIKADIDVTLLSGKYLQPWLDFPGRSVSDLDECALFTDTVSLTFVVSLKCFVCGIVDISNATCLVVYSLYVSEKCIPYIPFSVPRKISYSEKSIDVDRQFVLCK